MDLKHMLAEPYPYYYKGKDLVSVMIVLFLMSLGFNFLFEPFEVYRPEHKVGFFWICVIHSGNAVVVAAICLGLINLRADEDHWTVGKEILLILMILLLIGVSQFLIRDIIYANPHNWSWRYLLEEVRNTYLVGGLFVLILVPLNFLRLNTSHTHKAGALNDSRHAHSVPEPVEVGITTQLKSDDFSLDPARLIFARAEGNYLELYLEGHPQEKLLKRLTLKELEAQLADFPYLVKVHRSYLVNLNKIKHFRGNAQGYKLSFSGHEEPVPVSRGMIPYFEERLNSLSQAAHNPQV